MNAVIIDNEKPIREALTQLITAFVPQVNLVGEADSVQTGLDIIHTKDPDLVFLDVEMDDGTGMDLLRQIENHNFKIIFVTAHDKYAIHAFKFSAVDYLVKPVDPEELMNAVEKAQQSISKEQNKKHIEALLDNSSNESQSLPKKLVLRDAENIHFVKVEDIQYIKAEGSYSTFYLQNRGPIIVSKNLKEYEKLLDANLFIRSHHSYLVNLSAVVRFERADGGFLITNDAAQIPVSHRKKDEILGRLERL